MISKEFIKRMIHNLFLENQHTTILWRNSGQFMCYAGGRDVGAVLTVVMFCCAHVIVLCEHTVMLWGDMFAHTPHTCCLKQD